MWFLLLVAFFGGAASQIVSQEGDKCSRHYVCPPEFLRLSQNCYYFSKNKTSWQNAFFECQDLHGKFAIIRNAHQDKMLRSFLNKVSLVSVERWIGGVYDWQQMMWKWGASGKEIKYKGFSRMDLEDKEKLKWHCVVLDPAVQYKWSSRNCLEEKHFICQAKLRKVAKKERKKLQQQYNVDKYHKLNEVPVPEIPSEVDNNLTNLKEHKPNGHELQQDSNALENSAFAIRNETIIERRKERKRNGRKRKLCDHQHVVRNGTDYTSPQLKYGKRRRRNKSKESKESKEENASIENIQTKIYYSGLPQSPLHPRVITEELSFH